MAVPIPARPPLGAYFSTPEHLQKDLRPLNAMRLGALPISGYDHIPHIDPLDWISFTAQEKKVVHDNMLLVKSGEFECYYFADANPFIAQFQPDGRVIWKSVAPCDGRHVAAIANDLTRKGISVHVNTGNHGNADGLIPSAGNFHAANRLGDPGFFDQDYRNLNRVTGKVSILQLSAEVRPIYPEKANCIIDAWCFSLNTHFSDVINYLIPRDLIGHFIPTLYKDVATSQLMKKPMYSLACTRVEGRVHYYDKETVRNLEGAQPPGTAIICRLNRCSQKIFPQTLFRDKELELEIREFKQKVADEEANIQKVATLQGEVVAKDQRIGVLEGQVVTLEGENLQLTDQNTHLNQENTGLKGRVTDLTQDNTALTNDLDLERQEKNEVLSQKNDLSRENQILKQEIALNGDIQAVELQVQEALVIQQNELDIQEFIRHNETIMELPNQWWAEMLDIEKNRAWKDIQEFFHDTKSFGITYRSNAFLIDSFFQEAKLNHKEILQAIFVDGKEIVFQNTIKKMNRNLKKAQNRVWHESGRETLFYPLMDRLVDGGLVLNRLNTIAEENDVSVRRLERERWQQKEPDRYSAKTYAESVKILASNVLRYELCDRVVSSVREWPDTPQQEEAAIRMRAAAIAAKKKQDEDTMAAAASFVPTFS